jgi:hypothetical protein
MPKKIGSSTDGASHSRKIELLSIGYQTACSVEAGAQGLSVTDNSRGRAVM